MSARPVIVQVGPDPAAGGGMAAVLRSLLDSPLRERYTLALVVTHRPGSAAARVLVFLRALASLHRRLRRRTAPTLVHVHATVRGSLHRKAIIVAMARRAGVPVVLHVHAGAGDLRDFHRRLDATRRRQFARTLRSADRVLSVSAASARELEQRFGAAGVEVVDNPLPGPLPRLDGTRDPGSPPEILFLGGFANPVKGGRILLEALPEVRRGCPDVRLVLAGPGRPPLSTDPQARWVGWLGGAAKAQALSTADIVVLPSTSEGLPVALLEAMSYGRAIVATTVGAIPDVLTDGRDGVLVPPDDREALAAALGALARDPQRRDRLGAAARVRAEAFAPARIADHLDAIYRVLLAGREERR